MSMTVPFGVGAAAAGWLLELESATETPSSELPFRLFIASVFAFSAFPVLARVLDSSKLISSPVGIQALGLAAVEDLIAWSVLALIISVAPANSSGSGSSSSSSSGPATSSWNSLLVFAVLVVFIGVMMGLVRPALDRIYKRKLKRGQDINTTFIRQAASTHRQRRVLSQRSPASDGDSRERAGTVQQRGPATAWRGIQLTSFLLLSLVLLSSAYLFFGFLACSWFTEVLGVHAFFGAFMWGCIIPKVRARCCALYCAAMRCDALFSEAHGRQRKNPLFVSHALCASF